MKKLFCVLASCIVVGCLGILTYWFLTYSDNLLDVNKLIDVLQARSPYVVMAFLNLGIVLLLCVSGAIVYSKWIRKHRKMYVLIALFALCSAFLLHAMVYGIVLFVPVPYTLLSVEHITFRIFQGIDTIPFASNLILCYVFGIVIHMFAPQVLLGLFVAYSAMKKYIEI